MDVIYREYEPNQELEELQAKLFSEVADFPVTGKEIQFRYNQEKIDPKTVRYAFNSKGELLAYCQARDYAQLGQTHLGYPWAVPDCPREVQNKLFDELLQYLQQRKSTLSIRISLYRGWKKQIEYVKQKGFIEYERSYQYSVDLDIENLSKMELTEEDKIFTSRLATSDDIKILINLLNADPTMRNVLPTDETKKNYFNTKVLKDGHCVLIFHEKELVCASAPLIMKPDDRYLRGDKERIILRFMATRPGYVNAWRSLLVHFAKECLSKDWGNIPIQCHFGFMSNFPMAAFLSEIRPEIQVSSILFGLPE